MWPPATISHSSSGFTDHSRCARRRISGSRRSRRSRARTTAPKAIASSSFSQNVIRASEVPPSSAALHSAAVATGPYTETAFIQLDGISRDGICRPTRSPDCCSCRGVITYGLCPITAVRPLAAYEMESVEPAAGSTVSTATTPNAATRMGRTGGRAPRATATRPAITPAQPSTIATHRDTVTNVAVRCSGCHQGGPWPGRGMAGTETFGPAAEIAIMISAEAAMATVASQPVRRVSPGAPGRPVGLAACGDGPEPCGGRVWPTLSSSLTESPVCRS